MSSAALLLKIIFICSLHLLCHLTHAATTHPTACTRNGTYTGVHSPAYAQDFFLGLPFAQPPVGDLRLRLPAPLNSTWAGTRPATAYGPACFGYGEDTYKGAHNVTSEDCLTLNVIRPAGCENETLPVAVWIYGGGWFEGSSRDERYNLSFIVQQSVEIGTPIIGVGLNYRLSGWGWLWSREVVDAGVANLGLRDQRLALHWLQENIGAFGGDPRKVTIWGESAGAVSVGNHLLAYNGRDDGLFRGAISESGPLGIGLINPSEAVATKVFHRIVRKANCTNADDKLACLRRLSTAEYNTILISEPTEEYHSVFFGPLVDGDIIALNEIQQQLDGAFVDVPYICGQNTDEGTDFVPFGINNATHLSHYLSLFGIPSSTITHLLTLYPDDPIHDLPPTHPEAFNTTIGTQFKRAATLATDLAFTTPRRIAARVWSRRRLANATSPLYSYRFNTIPAGIPAYFAVTHFQEVAFVMHNVHGYGFPGLDPPYFGEDPFRAKPESYVRLSGLMSGLWVSFVAGGRPGFRGQNGPEWPPYDGGVGGANGTNYVFDALAGCATEADTFRGEGVDALIRLYESGRVPWVSHED